VSDDFERINEVAGKRKESALESHAIEAGKNN